MKRLIAILLVVFGVLLGWTGVNIYQNFIDQNIMQDRVATLQSILTQIIPDAGVPDSVGTVSAEDGRLNIPGFRLWAKTTRFTVDLGLTDAQHPSRLMDMEAFNRLPPRQRAYAITYDCNSYLEGPQSPDSVDGKNHILGVSLIEADDRSKSDEQLRVDSMTRVREYIIRGYDRHGDEIVAIRQKRED